VLLVHGGSGTSSNDALMADVERPAVESCLFQHGHDRHDAVVTA
jgi:hypothetical protein